MCVWGSRGGPTGVAAMRGESRFPLTSWREMRGNRDCSPSEGAARGAGVSRSTLPRLENGDPSAAAGEKGQVIGRLKVFCEGRRVGTTRFNLRRDTASQTSLDTIEDHGGLDAVTTTKTHATAGGSRDRAQAITPGRLFC